MAKNATQAVMEHCDRDEIISKLLLGISPKDIHSNLAVRYGDIDKKLVISEASIASFKKNSLNIYKTIQEDLQKTSIALATHSADNVDLALKSNPQYKEAMLKLANNELDVKTMMGNLILSVEQRIAQLTDMVQQDPQNVNTKTERLIGEYIDRLNKGLEQWHKYVLQAPDQIVQHNISIQHIDSHIAVFYDVIKRVLAQMDIETSLYFMEVFEEEMSKIKAPAENKHLPVEERLAEVKILNDQINDKLNQ